MNNKFLDIDGVKKLWEKTKEYVGQNSSSPSTIPSNELKKFTIELFKGSDWIRIAKIKDIYKNSNGIFNFSCYGVNDEVRRLFTTTTFSVNCALKKDDAVYADIICLNNAIELVGVNGAGSDSGSYMNEGIALAEETTPEVSNDTSEEETGTEVSSDEGADVSSDVGSDVGSDTGSGGGSVYGLLAIAVEEFDGERYICALINYPATQFYKYLEVEMTINDNLNFEYLEQLETVDLSSINVNEIQLLEGYEFTANKHYTICLTGNLKTFMDCVTATPPKSIYITMDYETDEDDGDGNFLTKRTTILEYSATTVDGVNTTDTLTIADKNIVPDEETGAEYGKEMMTGNYWAYEHTNFEHLKSGKVEIATCVYGNVIENISGSFDMYVGGLNENLMACDIKGWINKNDFTLILTGSNYASDAEIPVILNDEVIGHFKNVNSGETTITIPHFNADADVLIIDTTESSYVSFSLFAPIEEVTYKFGIEWTPTTNARLLQYNLSTEDTASYNFNLTLREEKRHKTEKFEASGINDRLKEIDKDLISLSAYCDILKDYLDRGVSLYISFHMFKDMPDEEMLKEIISFTENRSIAELREKAIIIKSTNSEDLIICSPGWIHTDYGITLTIKAFNISTGKLYYYRELDQVEGEPLVFTVKEIGGNVKPEDVLQIVEENSEEVTELDIGTSETYNVENDNQIPTTKAVAKIISEMLATAIGNVMEAEY